MSVQPIDLQTLFVRLDHVGKQVGLVKNGLIQSQEIVAQEIAKESEQVESQVTDADEISDGPEKTHDDDERQGMSSRKRKQARKDDGGEEHDESDLFRDPDLGQNIDLSG